MELLKTIVNCIWNIIVDYIAPMGNVCVAAITLIVFLFTYVFNKVKLVGISMTHSLWEGHSYSATLKNNSLRDICVKEVSLIVDDKTSYLINKYDVPIIIGPLKAITFKSQNFSIAPFQKGFVFNEHAFKCRITLSDSKIIFAKSKFKKNNRKKQKQYETPFVTNYTDGDKVITEFMKYKVVIIKNERFFDDFIILKSGLMNKPLAGFNMVSQNDLKDKNSMKKLFESFFNNEEYSVQVFDYSIESFKKKA